MFTEEHLPFAFWIPSHQPGHGYQSPQALVCLEVIGGALFAGCPCVVSTALQTLVCLLKEAPTHLTPTPRVCLNVFKRFKEVHDWAVHSFIHSARPNLTLQHIISYN